MKNEAPPTAPDSGTNERRIILTIDDDEAIYIEGYFSRYHMLLGAEGLLRLVVEEAVEAGEDVPQDLAVAGMILSNFLLTITQMKEEVEAAINDSN